ncbi:hypothetical protein ACSBR1_019062 [Camellia fascicularis]
MDWAREKIGSTFGYYYYLHTNMKKLKRNTKQLNSRVNYEVQRSRKRRRVEVELCQEDVRRIANDVQTLERLVQEVSWMNVFKCAELGKRVVEMNEEVEKLNKNGGFSKGWLIDDPTCGHAIPTAKSLVETNTSARNKEKIWNFLMDDAVRKIGVHGMGGIGKTTIMKHINDQLLDENFSDVIWVTVSRAFDIKNLQRQIAKELNIDLFDYKDELRSKIHNMLSKNKRYVLILDDLWKAFPLEEVGIPEPTRDNGCKLVLTTRLLEVCTKMNCKTVEMELLMEEEALNLFMKNVKGHQTVLTPKVKEIAKEVAKNCACLPLAIVTMAGCMRGVNDIHEWRNARKALQLMGKEERLFELLEFSYSRLKNEQDKHCFLYCALYPEDDDIHREELIEHWIAEDLICEMGNREAMFDEGHSILNKLIKTCLLVGGKSFGQECVWMHDLIRDMALKITSTSPRFMVRAGEGLKRVPHKDWAEDLERVSLMRNDIEELPSEPICPRLTTFLLRGNGSKVLRIPDSFFVHMRRLKVLDLSNTDIESLPNSISMLEDLHQLLLRKCYVLKYVPSLEKLKELKYFELTDSEIEEVPQGIEELVNLKKLRLDGNCNVKYVPSLEKLKALEHFQLTYCQIEEVPEGIEELVNLRELDLCWNHNLGMSPCRKLCRLTQLRYLGIGETKVIVSAEDLLCLKKLKVLYAQFHNVQELTKYVKSRQCKSLDRYDLVVGIVDENNQAKKQERVVWSPSFMYRSFGVDEVVLPSNIEDFHISRWDNHISLSDIQSLRAARSLRKFSIKECSKLESIFSSSCCSEDYHIPLTTIEKLSFTNLPNFRVLFDRVVPPHNISFNLKRLNFCKCPKIENIFSIVLLRNFPSLEELQVFDCKNVEEIIAEVEPSDQGGHRENDGSTITLRNLKILCLKSLPRLKSMYKGIMVCESLQIIKIWRCPMLKRLPISSHMNEDGEQTSTPPVLQHIRGEEEWWKSLEWDNPLTKTTLQPFFSRYYSEPMELQRDQGEENATVYDIIPNEYHQELQSDQGEELQSDQGEENAVVYDIIPNEYHQGPMELQRDQGGENATLCDIIPNEYHQGPMELQRDQGEENATVCDIIPNEYHQGPMELQRDQGEENASVCDIIPNEYHQGLMELQSYQGEENAIVYDIIPNKHHQGAKLLREEESDVFATKVPMQKPQYEATLGISDLLGKDESIIATGRRGGLSVDLDRLNNERKRVGLRRGVGLLMEPFSRKKFITKMADKLLHSLGKESSESILPAGKEVEDAALLFFHDMSALHVLDLSYTSIDSLPQSISRLNALQKLILRGCDFLMELPPEIGELTNLEVIDLEGTEIIYLPKEIAKLIKLSCLKVSFYRYANNYQESKHIDTIIPSASLSNLSRLNELSIDVNPDGDWWDVEVRTIIHDLCSLRELRTLKLYLPTIELLEELIRDSPSLIGPALTHFRLIVGRQVERFLSRLPHEVEEEFNNLEKSEKGLKYVNGEGIPIEIIEVLKHANAFFLEHHWTVNNLSEFGLQNMDKLKFCFLVECNELRTIIDAKQFYHEGDCEGDDTNESEQYSYFNEEMVLGSLQYLSIHYMKNMESICQGSVGKGCLSNLKFLALHTCLSLTTIFTVGMLRNLVNLEELIVEDCTKISSLVDLKNSDSKSGHFLPSLKKILLLELPKLVSISNGLCIAPKLERMVIFYCPKLVKLSTMEVSGKDLKVIKGENEWWRALKWHESDLSSDHQDYLASVFVPLRRDGDLMAQFTKD